MSRDIVVAKRYAKALFDLASASGVVEKVNQELRLIVDATNSNPDVTKLLDSPSVALSEKMTFVKEAFGSDVSELVYNTLSLVIERGRQDIITPMYEAYVKIAGEALGQAYATIYTAKLLDEQELSAVATQFGQITGRTIVAEQILQPELIGGVKVRIGDRLYDGSIAGKLARLQKTLNSKAL